MRAYKIGEPPIVEECVVQTYPDEDGKHWWRHCLTCDDGSNKYGKHRRGHKTEADAMMSKRDHENQMRENRIAKIYFDRWRLAVVLAKTWQEFSELWDARFHASYGRTPLDNKEETPERLEIMYDVQRRYVDAIEKEAEKRERRATAERASR